MNNNDNNDKAVAERYNEHKNRLELIDPFVIEEMGKVLTKGAQKYDVQNWRKGLSFIETIGSLKRHLSAFEAGVNYDMESGSLHMAHIMVNSMFLLYYQKYKPGFDDRVANVQAYQTVGYDIDDVLFDFVGGWRKEFGLSDDWKPASWHNGEFTEDKFKTLTSDFWLGLKPKVNPETLYPPVVYITSRINIAKETTQELLDKNNFPKAPIVFAKDKAQACNEYELDIFFDDRLKHYFNILSNSSTKPYLIDMAHNRSAVVANRIHKINDSIELW